MQREYTAIVDECLAQLPALLLERRITLKQKHGYKAGKLSRTRNWCQLVNGDVALRVHFPNNRGQVKTWKLFARFDAAQSPRSPWDKPEQYQRKKAQWMISGDDVWGVAYEDIKEYATRHTDRQLPERLADDLVASFTYSRQRYC